MRDYLAPPSISLTSLNSEHELTAIEGLGVAAWRVALHAPKAHEAKKHSSVEPMLVGLRAESVQEFIDFPVADRLAERYEDARNAHVSIVFRNLVFKDEVIAEGVPSQFREKTMILVRIFAAMGENHIG